MPRQRNRSRSRSRGRRRKRTAPITPPAEGMLPKLPPSGLPPSIPTPPRPNRLGIPDFKNQEDRKKKKKRPKGGVGIDLPPKRSKRKKKPRGDIGVNPTPPGKKRIPPKGPKKFDPDKKKRKPPFKKGPFDVDKKAKVPANAPEWWKPLKITDTEDPNVVLAGAINALIPGASPRDRQALVMQLQALFPGKFRNYSIKGNVTQGQQGQPLDPSQFRRSLTGQVEGRREDPIFQSQKRAKDIANALDRFRKQSSLKGASGAGLRFLAQVADLTRRFGTVESSQSRGSFKQKNFEEMLGRLLRQADTPELAPYAEAARAIALPAFPQTRT